VFANEVKSRCSRENSKPKSLIRSSKSCKDGRCNTTGPWFPYLSGISCYYFVVFFFGYFHRVRHHVI